MIYPTRSWSGLIPAVLVPAFLAPAFLAPAFLAPLILVLASVGARACERWDAVRLYRHDRLLDIRIDLSHDDWAALRDQSRSFARALSDTPAQHPYGYFRGTITIDGFRIPDVGIRKKGFIGSLDDLRPSLKIHFSKFKPQSPIAGVCRLTLNNNKQDRALVSQLISYRTFRAAGVAAPRSNLAKVTVNGVNLGIYSNVESIKGPFLEDRFGDSSGELHEGIFADFYPDSIKKFECKNEAGGSNSHLRRLAESLEGDGAVDLKRIGSLLDIDAFVKYWAVESMLGFWDGYTNNQNNYFVFRSPANAKVYFIPWGADSSLANTTPIPPYTIKTKSVHAQSVVANRLYRHARIQRMYGETMRRLLARHWNEKELLSTVDCIERMVLPHLHADQRDFAGKLQWVRRFIKTRRDLLERELADGPPSIPSAPRRPVYYRPVGQAEVSFDAIWNRGTSAPGSATVRLSIGGRPVKWKQLAVVAEPSRWPTGTTPRPPTIVVTGTRVADGKKMTMVIATGRRRFQPTGARRVHVHGMLIEGLFGFLNPSAMKMVSGYAVFEKAGTQAGAEVKGTVSLQVMQMVGGKSSPYAPASPRP